MLPTAGSIPATEGTLYTVPNGHRARIAWMAVDNPGTVRTTFKFYVTVSGTKVGLTPTLALQGGDFGEESKELWLYQGDYVSGVASATGLTFVFSGVEERLQ